MAAGAHTLASDCGRTLARACCLLIRGTERPARQRASTPQVSRLGYATATQCKERRGTGGGGWQAIQIRSHGGLARRACINAVAR
jgi:hypothetical protein